MIGKMRVFGEKRAVQIGAKGIAIHGSFTMIFGIVAVTFQPFAQRLCRAEVGTPAMVFKAYQRAAVPLNGDVADTAWDGGSFVDGPGVEDAQAAHIGAAGRSVIVGEQLIAATDGQYWHIVFHGSPQADTLHIEDILRNGRLFSILSSADEEQVVFVGSESIADAQWDDAQRDAAHVAAALQRDDIAAITVQF